MLCCVERVFFPPFHSFKTENGLVPQESEENIFLHMRYFDNFTEVLFQPADFNNNVTPKVGEITLWAGDIIQFYVTAQWLGLPTELQLPWKMALIFPGTDVGCRWMSCTLHYQSQHLLLCWTVSRHRQMLTHLNTHRYKSGFVKTAPDITALALHPYEKLWRFSSHAAF